MSYLERCSGHSCPRFVVPYPENIRCENYDVPVFSESVSDKEKRGVRRLPYLDHRPYVVAGGKTYQISLFVIIFFANRGVSNQPRKGCGGWKSFVVNAVVVLPVI